MRSLVFSAALLVLLTFLRPPACAADDVSIGMVRLPTAVFIALDQGFFAAEGLNVTPVFSQNGAEIVPELATGKIDVALASPGASLFNALAIGVDARIVADPWVAPRVAGSNDYAFIDVRKDLDTGGAFKPRDAKGLTFAITAHGQMTELFAAAYLQSGGLSLADVHVVELPFPEMEAAMRNHAIDLASSIEPYPTLGARSGASVKAAGITTLMPGYVQAVLMYGNRIVTQRRDIGVRFMRAYARANTFLLRNLATRSGRSEIARIYQKYIPLDDPSVYEETGLPAGPADLSVDVDGPYALRWQMTQYVAQGLVKKVPDLKAAVDNSFVKGAR
ncbi:MAG TPA: ABC transporter substrate-binding protein [Candidatus Lustribacter sp.]|nr:ABC transporter substrate-binding protein [Candidatus Lustribacter sp.]